MDNCGESDTSDGMDMIPHLNMEICGHLCPNDWYDYRMMICMTMRQLLDKVGPRDLTEEESESSDWSVLCRAPLDTASQIEVDGDLKRLTNGLVSALVIAKTTAQKNTHWKSNVFKLHRCVGNTMPDVVVDANVTSDLLEFCMNHTSTFVNDFLSLLSTSFVRKSAIRNICHDYRWVVATAAITGQLLNRRAYLDTFIDLCRQSANTGLKRHEIEQGYEEIETATSNLMLEGDKCIVDIEQYVAELATEHACDSF